MKSRKAFACLALLVSFCAVGAAPGGRGEARVALVIGNAAYRDSPLINPVNDARALGAALRSAGFDVIELHDQGSAAMRRAIREFGEKLRGRDAGLFYFAGHGVQVRGRNFLVPVDADIRYEDEIEDQSVEIGLVLGKMESAKARVNLVILDACRNNPFARSQRSAQNGLAAMEAPLGTLVAFATSPGQVASDGMQGNGLYTTYLVREMTQPGLKVEDVFKRVRAAVRMASAGRQIPWENTSLEGDFYFRSAPDVDSAAIELERKRAQEEAIQQAVASALTRSREQAEREKQKLEASYAQKLEVERAAFRKEAAERIASLEQAALAAARPATVEARPEALAPIHVPSAPSASVPPAEPLAELLPVPNEPRERADDVMQASVLLALGVDPQRLNRLAKVTDEVARALKPAQRRVGDTWTYYRTMRDGTGVERRNYATGTVTSASDTGFADGTGAIAARFDLEGNRLAGMLRPGVEVVYEPADPVYRFPLVPGASWSAKSRERQPTQVTEVEATVTVTGWEDVTTPAGSFRAMKISQVANRRSEPFPGQSEVSKRVSNYWYVPALRNVAKYQALEVTDPGIVIMDQVWELDSFELK